jgi:hypothetical protein
VVPPFDIFKIVDIFLWVETVPTLNAAKTRVKELIAERSTVYLIFSQRTGHKISLKPGRFNVVRRYSMTKVWEWGIAPE